MNRKQQVGKWGENLAREYLEKCGFQFVAANMRTPYGEVDLIFLSKNEVIFVEVKTRTKDVFGMPEDSVIPSKINHLKQSSEAFMHDHPEFGNSWRIDVIAIQGSPENPNDVKIEWFENVAQ